MASELIDQTYESNVQWIDGTREGQVMLFSRCGFGIAYSKENILSMGQMIVPTKLLYLPLRLQAHPWQQGCA